MRIGRLAYANVAPFFFRLELEHEEVEGVPTGVNEALLAGEVDAAPVSSVFYARHADRLRLLPRLCIAAHGEVESVQLVGAKTLDAVETVAITSESASSVALVRVLLPRVTLVGEDEEADARLLIGDRALWSVLHDPAPHHDLGRLWSERTGLPMVFAVWATNAEAPGAHELEEALLASLRCARNELELVAQRASARHGLPAGFLARYLARLIYEAGPREHAGLARFLELADIAAPSEAIVS